MQQMNLSTQSIVANNSYRIVFKNIKIAEQTVCFFPIYVLWVLSFSFSLIKNISVDF